MLDIKIDLRMCMTQTLVISQALLREPHTPQVLGLTKIAGIARISCSGSCRNSTGTLREGSCSQRRSAEGSGDDNHKENMSSSRWKSSGKEKEWEAVARVWASRLLEETSKEAVVNEVEAQWKLKSCWWDKNMQRVRTKKFDNPGGDKSWTVKAKRPSQAGHGVLGQNCHTSQDPRTYNTSDKHNTCRRARNPGRQVIGTQHQVLTPKIVGVSWQVAQTEACVGR